MFKKVIVLVIGFLIISSSALAHVMNRNTVFEDLALTEAADEVVLLSALGIVSYLDGSFEFKPQVPLTAKDLAAWLAGYSGLQGDSSDELAQEALAGGLISTLTGEATYELVNEVYFHSELLLENPTATMTREQFALFVVAHLYEEIGGHTLLDLAQFSPGPSGTVERVERVEKQTATGSSAHVYVITIDGVAYELSLHPNVIADSADPTVWVGQQVAQSFYGPNVAIDRVNTRSHPDENDLGTEQINLDSNNVAETALQFLVVGEQPFIENINDLTAGQEQSQVVNIIEERLANVKMLSLEGPKENTKTWTYVAIIVLLFLGVGSLFFMKRKIK